MRGPQDTTQAAWSNGKPSVFLVVFKIPGANVIKTVEAIKGTLTSLQASIPPTIHISVLSDRTKTIRASVGDVEFTLALTIVLMVAVIFIFLRSVWATIIRSVTVPLALLGACALMGGGLQHRQSVADGLHHLRGLCRGRRDRNAREHNAPHRGR